MNKLKNAFSWFLSGLCFRIGYFWTKYDWDFGFGLGLSTVETFEDGTQVTEPWSIGLYLGPLTLYVESKNETV